jgi:hypothetical protein
LIHVPDDSLYGTYRALEKIARALEVPMYRLFTDEAKVEKPDISFSKAESAPAA